MFDDIRERLTGCFYTVFTPFLEDESIDYESLTSYLGSLYKQGARKYYVMAYNSRYSQLTHNEIYKLNEHTIKTVKSIDRNNIVIVGDPIHCSTRETIEYSRHAKECGADLVSLIIREKYFTDEQILEHYSSVGLATNMPILVHEMPFLSGMNGKQMHWPNSLVKSLPKIPQIVAIKEDAHDYETTKTVLQLEPDIRVIIAGAKSKFVKYKDLGARAYLNGISIIDARLGETFWDAYESDNTDKINYIIDEIEAPFFNECVSVYGWHRTNKALLQAAGYMHRRDRMPLKHLSDDEYQTVKNIYKRIKSTIDILYK